jgi:hypothetical protein
MCGVKDACELARAQSLDFGNVVSQITSHRLQYKMWDSLAFGWSYFSRINRPQVGHLCVRSKKNMKIHAATRTAVSPTYNGELAEAPCCQYPRKHARQIMPPIMRIRVVRRRFWFGICLKSLIAT